MSDDNKNDMFDTMKKAIEEGKLFIHDNNLLFNQLVPKSLERKPTEWVGNFIATDPGLEPLKPLFVKIHYGQMYISDTPDADQSNGNFYKDAMNTMWGSMDEQSRRDFLLGERPVNHNFTTAADQPTQPEFTREYLEKMMADLPKDPLLQKGVQKDWVCVINPALVSHIEHFYKNNEPNHFVPMNKLDYVMGRRVFIINVAPLNVEYMSEETMYMKYAEYFAEQAKWLAEQEAKDKDED